MYTRRTFISLAGTAVLGAAVLGLSGCGQSRGVAQSSSASIAASSTSSASSSSAASSASAIAGGSTRDALVVYFSHVGENYGVGVIEEGNTAIVAKMIAEKARADVFEIVPSEAYPDSYSKCCDVALAEQNERARPAYKGDIDLAPYKTIYLGYPIWWGDLPMCVYTFLEAHGWSGKEVRPFCTHAGSGLVNTVSSIQAACSGASAGQGLSIAGTTAQNSRDEARSAVEAWLA